MAELPELKFSKSGAPIVQSNCHRQLLKSRLGGKGVALTRGVSRWSGISPRLRLGSTSPPSRTVKLEGVSLPFFMAVILWQNFLN